MDILDKTYKLISISYKLILVDKHSHDESANHVATECHDAGRASR